MHTMIAILHDVCMFATMRAPSTTVAHNPDEVETQAFEASDVSCDWDRAPTRTPSGLSTTTKRALFQAHHPKRPDKDCPITPQSISTTTPGSIIGGSSESLTSSPPPTPNPGPVVVGAVLRTPHEKYDVAPSLMNPKLEIVSDAEELAEEPTDLPLAKEAESAQEAAEELSADHDCTEDPAEEAPAEACAVTEIDRVDRELQGSEVCV